MSSSPSQTDERERRRCDPDLIDRRRCRADGIKAEAAYGASKETELDQLQTTFKNTEAAYRTAREAAGPVVRGLRQQLSAVLDQLRCLINSRRTVHRLDEAWAAIEERLEACGEEGGCVFTDDCDFGDVEHCPPDELAALIAEIERRTAAAKTAFDTLIKEPQELAKGVEALKTELADIATKMGGDAATTDFKRLYARALVAERALSRVWRGFRYPHDFVECLCAAMTCQVEGHHAIGVLKRKEAIDACHRKAAEDVCTDLRTFAADRVMDEYAKRLPRPGNSYEDAPPEEGTDDDGADSYEPTPAPSYEEDRPDRPGGGYGGGSGGGGSGGGGSGGGGSGSGGGGYGGGSGSGGGGSESGGGGYEGGSGDRPGGYRDDQPRGDYRRRDRYDDGA